MDWTCCLFGRYAFADFPLIRSQVPQADDDLPQTSILRIWSVGEDYKLRFWDGCLREDWIGNRMDGMVDEYCTFSSIKIGVLTWNVDGQSPTLLDSTNQQNKEILSRFIQALDGPDMLVFNLQEAIDLSDLTLAARGFIVSNEPVAVAFDLSIVCRRYGIVRNQDTRRDRTVSTLAQDALQSHRQLVAGPFPEISGGE